jgi:hypothetical protein
MANYQIDLNHLDDYLRFNVNNPIIRNRLLQNIDEWMNYGAGIQEINPWIIYLNFGVYPGFIHQGWRNGNQQYFYEDDEINEIVNYIITNNLRLPGQPGYRYTYSNPVMSIEQMQLIIRLSSRHDHFGKKTNKKRFKN